MSDRYQRHRLVPGWDQRRLADATVVVAGVGALGNEAARLLAMSGVGALVLCDPDRVEESNLSRAVLFRERDIGRFKVDAAAEALADLAPGLRVVARRSPIVQGVGLAELREASLVLGCLDARLARLQLAGRCRLVRAPSLDGGTHPWGGEVRPYLDPDGRCYACAPAHLDGPAGDDAPAACGRAGPGDQVGATGAVSAVVASWMATIALRFLMGLSCPSATLKVDCAGGTTTLVDEEPDPDCPLHRTLPEARRVDVTCDDTVADLRRALGGGDAPLAWEPLQERVECSRCGRRETRCGVGPRTPVPCPECGAPARVWKTAELGRAPADAVLRDLGIPPREILAVRTSGGGRAAIELRG